MPEWDAEVVVDEALVRALIGEQFPELDASSVRQLGVGWDNAVWAVEERWAFRFPRRGVAIPGVERELAVLPLLAPLLPAPIPVPAFVGAPSDRFAWPFFGAPLLAGVEPADASLTHEERAELGAALGRFLRALHDVQLDVDLPVDPLGRGDMSVRVPRARQCLAEVEQAGVWSAPPAAKKLLDAAALLPRSHENRLVHGDLHLRHVLVEDGGLSAVIDWGDLCRGDRAIDLQLVWCLLPPAGRARFKAEYGDVDAHRALRARAAALYFCAMLAAYAHGVGDANLLQESVAGLERTLVG